MTGRLRVLVVDDHPIFRDGLQLALSACEDVEVVGAADTAAEAVSAAIELRPDVVVMDLHLPDGSGSDAAGEILRTLPTTRILVLTMSDDDAALLAAVRSGAHGYLVKGADQATTVAAVRAVARGEATFGRDVSARVLALLAAEPLAPNPFPELTEREREVLQLLEKGLTNDAIAARLGVSSKTARNHVSNVLVKLGAGDRQDAADIARERRGQQDLSSKVVAVDRSSRSTSAPYAATSDAYSAGRDVLLLRLRSMAGPTTTRDRRQVRLWPTPRTPTSA